MAKVLRGADVLVRALANAGVKTIFALSGNQIMSIFDACIDSDIDIVHVRHEGAAVYMAEAYAQITGNVGVALVTAGAGVGNATGALFSVSESDTSLLLISGDSPVGLDGKGAFQELDQVGVTSAVTRWSHRVVSSNELGHDLAKALQIARTPQPGPVHLSLPVDILKRPCTDTIPDMGVVKCAPDVAAVHRVGQAIANAERPLILTGPSLNSTRQPLLVQGLQQAFCVPVVNMESPRGLNDPCLGNFKSVVQDADVIISLGKRVDFTVGYADGVAADWYGVFSSHKIAEQAALNLAGQLKIGVVDDVINFASALTEYPAARVEQSEWNHRVRSALVERVERNHIDSGISPVELCQAVQKAIDKCASPVLICDGGEFGQWAQASLSAPRRVINGLSGSIGGGVGYAIGAAKALKDATVFVLTGDGSIGFHLAEIETAVRNNLSLIVVVGNDSCWNAEHQLQVRDYGADRLFACDLSEVSYSDACIAMGGSGRHVRTVNELHSALAGFKEGVVCLDVKLVGLAAPAFPD